MAEIYIHLSAVVSYIIIVLLLSVTGQDDNPFKPFQQAAISENPIREAGKRVGYGSQSIQPYYVCDSDDSGSALPLAAWHYSCKQACMDQNEKTHVYIKRARWHYIGEEITVYKVLANEVCYMSHENIWGYCTQSQTSKPVTVSAVDLDNLPSAYKGPDSKVLGVTHVINSGPAECSYLSDNTKCSKDYIITYTTGRSSKRSEEEDLVLNIYSDGIRTKPAPGRLYNNDAAWMWEPSSVTKSKECGWSIYAETVCKVTNSSEIMSCPDIGYNYNIHTLQSKKTCVGQVYDINGPAPFLYSDKRVAPNRAEVMSKAKEGKGDPDINLITGINTALEEIEETYCSSSCDLFSRGQTHDDKYVLDTPIGNWRATGDDNDRKLVPCQPTATWRIKSPTHVCHGKDHLLVEDSATHHTSSWDVTRDYIIASDTCNGGNSIPDGSKDPIREQMAANKDIKFNFWTGDTMEIKPPYQRATWTRQNRTIGASSSWFSKVELNKGMLHNPTDVSRLMTTMVDTVKQEVRYNVTQDRSIRKLVLDEFLGGVTAFGAGIWSTICNVLSSLPKFLILVTTLLVAFLAARTLLEWYYRQDAYTSAIKKSVSFLEAEPSTTDRSSTIYHQMKRKPGSRSSKLSKELSFL